MSRPEPLLELDNLSVKYPEAELPALERVSFSVGPGERILLLGPSGGGKSTLLRAVIGLIPHSTFAEVSGEVRLLGAVAGLPAERARHVGVVFQDPESQLCTLTVADEVAFGLENQAVPPREMDERIDAALGEVGLAHKRHARVDRLSGGEKQRLATAAVRVMNPKLLLFDEPTANLDPEGVRAFWAMLDRLVEADPESAFVCVEHRLEHFVATATRVLVLDRHGELVLDEEPRGAFGGSSDVLERLGVWQPAAARVWNRLGRGRHGDGGGAECGNGDGGDGDGGSGAPPGRAPLTPEELGEALRRVHPGGDGGESLGDPAVVCERLGVSRGPGAWRRLARGLSPRGGVRQAPSEGDAEGPAVGAAETPGQGPAQRAAGEPAEEPGEGRAESRGQGRRKGAAGGPTVAPARGPANAPAEHFGEEALRFEGVSFGYFRSVPVLHGISAAVRERETVGLIGHNGSGKSTLAALALGVLKPDEGQVRLCGEDPSRLPASRMPRLVGFAFQNPEHQFVTDTVFDEIAFGLRKMGLNEDEIGRRTADLLERMRLAELRGRNPFSLSHGEKRRLTVAAMLACRPRLFVLDEPTFGQDPETLGDLEEMMGGIAKAGAGCLIISHDLDLILRRCDRALALSEGRLLADGEPERILRESELLRTAGLAPPESVRIAEAIGL